MNLRDLLINLGRLSLRRYTATKCGHRTKRTGIVSAFGRTITTKMPINKNGSVDYCLDCIGKMAIKCAWCGNPIFIGTAVTIGLPVNDFKVPKYAVAYKKNPPQFVGCFSWNCADVGAGQAGFWMLGKNGKGYVER